MTDRLEQAVVYRPKQDIAGVRPYLMLPREEDREYFDNCGGAPEADLITWAAQFLHPDKAFIDVGTHIGTWSATYGILGYDVYGYEPQQWLYRLMRATLALNFVSDNYCYHSALSDRMGEATLTAPYADGGGGSIVVGHYEPAITEKVRVSKLDACWGHEQIALIKIDAEGAELDVLRGAKGTILLHKPKIVMEMWDQEKGQRREEVFTFVQDVLHYKMTPITWPEQWLLEPEN